MKPLICARINSCLQNGVIKNGPQFIKFLKIVVLLSISFFTFSCALTPNAAAPRQKSAKEEALSKRNIGEAYIMQGNFTAALKELLEAEKLNPEDAVTHNYLGITYKNKQLFENAISHFEKALDLNPGYSIAKNNLGVTYLDQENWDAAITCFNDVLTDILYTTPQFPLSNLGWAYYNKGDYRAATTYYKKALEFRPDFIVALNGLGQTYMAEKKYHDAAEIFEKILKSQSRESKFYFELAKAYEGANEKEKAVKAYLKVIELSPDSEMAEEAKTKINN